VKCISSGKSKEVCNTDVFNSIQFYLASIIAAGVTLGKVKLHKLYNIKHSIKLYYIIPYRNLVKILSMDLKRVIKLYEDR
jgi:hypothetical protein